jgi:signal transduction histidine kinase
MNPPPASDGVEPAGEVRVGQLADEQAALRRVATLVAKGAQPAEVFSAVADELGHLIGADASYVTRVELSSGHRPGPADDPPGDHGEPEGTCVVAGSYGRASEIVPVGFRFPLVPGTVSATALRTGRPARGSGDQVAKGPYRGVTGKLGLRAAVATPIVVEARYWGVALAATSRQDFPPGTESRMADFTELAATAIANAQAEEELRELAGTQAALRRLATLVARGEPAEAVFAAATREARRHFGGGTARMIRYEPDGTATLLANEGTTGPHVRVGERWEGYPPTGLTVTVRRTGQAARVHDYSQIPGGEATLREGHRSAVAVPIHVNGRLWGMIAVGSGQGGPLPPDTEQRMTEFTDLVATAVANAENRAALEASRDELARLLDEQAALRRVATLVARGLDPAEIFLAVSEEIRKMLDADSASIGRFEPDGVSVVVVSDGAGDLPVNLPAGTHVRLRDFLAPAVVRRTGRSAQVEEDLWSGVPDPVAGALRELGIRSMVASPIIVDGRLWGVVNAMSTRGPFPAGTADRMADFTELVATAIGNAQSRAELAASRTRVVAAADKTRRRIERDLHDGIQQHLLALALRLRSAAARDETNEIQAEIAAAAAGLVGVIDELREISSGIHPAILSGAGLRPALRALGRRSAIPVDMDLRIDGRLPEPVEVGAYYVVSEMLTNAAKHARASVAEVHAEVSGGMLRLRVRDDGAGGADPVRGSGLTGLKDRVEALGGTFSMDSPPGGGTAVSCELPVVPVAADSDR